jgi:hypothetical protein
LVTVALMWVSDILDQFFESFSLGNESFEGQVLV